MANFGGSVISHVPDFQRIVLLHFQQISVFFCISSTTLPPQANGTHKTQAENKSVETEGNGSAQVLTNGKYMSFFTQQAEITRVCVVLFYWKLEFV